MLPSQPETTEGGDQPAATDSGNQPATTESGKPLFPEDLIAHLATLVPDTLDNIIDITALGGSSLNGHHPNSYYTGKMFSFAFPIITPKGPGRVRLPLTTIQSIEQMSEGAGLFSCAVTYWNPGVKTSSAFHILIKSFHVMRRVEVSNKQRTVKMYVSYLPTVKMPVQSRRVRHQLPDHKQ
jgi:hypothetical protein